MKRVGSILLSNILLICIVACSPDAVGTLTWQEQYDLGIRYLSEGNYEEAIIAFTAAIEIDPKQAFAYVGRGDAYMLSDKTEENLAAAQADYEQAIELDETLVEAYLNLADVFIRQGVYANALEILTQGLEKTNNNQTIADKFAEIEGGNHTDSTKENYRNNLENNQAEIKSARIKGIYYGADGMPNYSENYFYDLDGYLSKIERIDSGTSTLLECYEYDKFGNIITRNSGSGTTAIQNIYEGPILISSHNEGGWWSEYFYDSGRLVSITTYLSSGKIMGVDEFLYNDNQLSAINSYNHVVGEKSLEYLTHEYWILYDSNQRISIIQHSYKGNAPHSYALHYNENGNLTGYEHYDADGNLIATMLYEYGDVLVREDSKSNYPTPAYLSLELCSIPVVFH